MRRHRRAKLWHFFLRSFTDTSNHRNNPQADPVHSPPLLSDLTSVLTRQSVHTESHDDNNLVAPRLLSLCLSLLLPHQGRYEMATKPGAADGFGPVLAALATMQSNAVGREKTEAHEFLEKFQKSVRGLRSRGPDRD